MPVARFVLPALAMVAAVPAQGVGAVAADGLPLVLPSRDGAKRSAMRSYSQGLTADGRGRYWCLVHEEAGGRRSLFVFRSDDRGASWQKVTAAPGTWDEFGAIAGAPGSDVLRVAWGTRLDRDGFTSAVQQDLDGSTGAWIGVPEVLQRGTGEEDQYGISDLGVAADGGVAVLVSTHRHPPKPPWPSGWSTGLMLRDTARNAWRGPFPLHTNRFGVWCNLQLHDGRAHVSFRTTPGHSMIGYRSFVLAEEGFEQPQDVEVSMPPRFGLEVANASALAVDPFGGRTVLYPFAGADQGGEGRLMVAHAAPGEPWNSEMLVRDPELRVGNVGHEHFALVHGPGRQLIALYSKVSEQHRVLYRRILEQGRPMDAERAVARSEYAGAYWRISSMRDPRLTGGVQAIVSGVGAGDSLGVRAVRAERPSPVRWQ